MNTSRPRWLRDADTGVVHPAPYGLRAAAEPVPPAIALSPHRTLRACHRVTVAAALLGALMVLVRPGILEAPFYALGLCAVGALAAMAAATRRDALLAALLEQPAIRDYAEHIDLPTVEEVTMGDR